MKISNFSLIFLRLTISYIWLKAGLSKLISNEFINTFPGLLQGFAKESTFSFYSTFLNNYVIPHSQVIAQLVVWGEILTGIAFLLGFPMLIATLAGICMNLNYFLIANSTPSQFLNILLITSQFFAYANGAGKIWGLETKLKK